MLSNTSYNMNEKIIMRDEKQTCTLTLYIFSSKNQEIRMKHLVRDWITNGFKTFKKQEKVELCYQQQLLFKQQQTQNLKKEKKLLTEQFLIPWCHISP